MNDLAQKRKDMYRIYFDILYSNNGVLSQFVFSFQIVFLEKLKQNAEKSNVTESQD